MNPDVPQSLTLVLSSARSGSTLLCRDIASLGGLGFPREYMKGFGAVAKRGEVSETDVLDRAARGSRKDAPTVAAIKLMVPQAAPTYRAISGRRLRPGAAMSQVVTWARHRFERVLLVFLVRNALDQAISNVVARETGVFHSTDPRFAGGPAELGLEDDDLNRRILHQLGPVVRNQQILSAVHAQHADLGLMMTYEQLTRDTEETTRALVAHARAQGFDVRRDVVTRKLTKIISDDRSATIRESFLDFLRREPGIWPSAHAAEFPWSAAAGR
ncbi:Stf0 family sulfotransferase [Nocardioides bizhenqiangii]|uniref:Stf0 family sulfotransferase n=1 Tax=Nocardioides bizhenqiangii TaxID=3095076 RepID=A0ABZ0ZV16_9ACTN|nr:MULTISPECIES: Stf0 family sulfotransferase [unclassified Nocardioides]MDZ5623101.1 Stf0 family sulfotransferase [Nocardioides sp. HM23]WQQ28077.1 Stf0 family sulfotransferase [Nocardioides sp. HM61]